MADYNNEDGSIGTPQGRARTLADYWKPTLNQHYSGIRRQPIDAEFELKPALISLVQQHQFSGYPEEDPNAHLATFLELAHTVHINGVNHDVIKLNLFPFSLRDKARSWMQSMPPGSIDSWGELAEAFLTKFFPPPLTSLLRAEISQFRQGWNEPLYDAWDRFKEMLRKCPTHGYELWSQLQIFYNGLIYETKSMVDAAAGGSIMNKTDRGAYQLLEELAKNNYRIPIDKSPRGSAVQRVEIGIISALESKIDAIMSRLNKQEKKSKDEMAYVQFSNQQPIDSAEQFADPSFVRNNRGYIFRPNNNLPQFYNSDLRNQENFHYAEQKNAGQTPHQFSPDYAQPGIQGQGVPSSNYQGRELYTPFEEQMLSFMADNNKRVDVHERKFEDIDVAQANTNATLKKLENLIVQLALNLKEQPQRSLPRDIVQKPKECMAATARSGGDVPNQMLKEEINRRKNGKQQVIEKEEEEELKNEAEGSKEEEPEPVYVPPPPYQPPIPFPQRFEKKKFDEQCAKFLDTFKKLKVNIPLAEVLARMPNYMKFMKEIMSNKTKLESFGALSLSEVCSAALQRKMPEKLKNPGSFTIPCIIGEHTFSKALCDLGASINVMPLSIMKKLKLRELTPTSISVQLADGSLAHPKGIIEDVLVKVGKFIFPADFVVLDMKENGEVPPILGRPFLATGQALIDVKYRELTLRVGSEQEKFKQQDVNLSEDGKGQGFQLKGSKVNNAELPEKEKNEEDSRQIEDESLMEIASAEQKCEATHAKGEVTAAEEKQGQEVDDLMPREVKVSKKRKGPQKVEEKEKQQNNAEKGDKIFKDPTRKWHNKSNQWKKFKSGDKVLLLESRKKLLPDSLELRWYGPFTVTSITHYGAICIKAKSGKKFLVNGRRLKKYEPNKIQTRDVLKWVACGSKDNG